MQADWATKLSGLASFPQSSLSYCSYRSPTAGIDGLSVWPIRAFLMLFLFPHTNLSALAGSTAKQEIHIQNFSLCTVSIFMHMHEILNGCYFHYRYFWIIFLFYWNTGCLLGPSQETMLLNCCQLLHWNTIPSDRQGKQFLVCLPPRCQRLPPVFGACGRQANKQTNALSHSEHPGKGQNHIFAEYCAATPLHACVSICKAYFQSYKKGI